MGLRSLAFGAKEFRYNLNAKYRKFNISNVVSVVCTLIDNDTTVMTLLAVDNSTDNAKPHSICFLPQYQ